MKAVVFAVALLVCGPVLFAKVHKPGGCARPAPGSVVQEPEDLRSHHGVLRVELTYRDLIGANGHEEYCYQSPNGAESPTLRLKPDDLLILKLKNKLTEPAVGMGPGPMLPGSPMSMPMPVRQPCDSSIMTPLSTNLHFHGLTVPPTCHEDDVLRTLVQPGAPPFEYRFRIPENETAGLYWYHPHVHGFTNSQVLGGASGALIIEGIARANRLLAGMPERVFVIRDMDLLHPNAAPVQSGNVPPPIVLRDAEGDILNTGTGGGKPAKDLSINFVPVPYPEYPPAKILVRPNERQLWRVLNGSAITYVDLQVLVANKVQPVGVVSLDGVPINEDGISGNRILWESHILLPPAGRVEFIFRGVPKGAQASFITRSVDTGPAGENDPTRPLATIVASDSASEPRLRLSPAPKPMPPPSEVWLGDVKPVRTRTLYFSEKPSDPNDPKSPTVFMITVEGQKAEPFDPGNTTPNIIVHQGDVEDWIVQNRTQELHAFHIHQLHFLLTDWNGVPVYEPFLRDTINVPYWDGKSSVYPSVRLRMDFRDPNIVGTFVYHCHLLEHEDGGMMGTIQVLPRSGPRVGSTTDENRPRAYELVHAAKR
jgi:FtsP/CotA-like multicopper oxidase with cupredoxin domain